MQEWTLKQALDFVTAARPQVSPNAGFMARLIRLEESLHGTKTVKVQPPLSRPVVCGKLAAPTVMAAVLSAPNVCSETHFVSHRVSAV